MRPVQLRRSSYPDCGKSSKGAIALGMDYAFGNPLAVLVGQLLEQLVILHEERAARTGRYRVLIIGYGRTGRSGLFL